MTKDERAKFLDIHDDITQALKYLNSGRVSHGHEMVRSAYERVCVLFGGNKATATQKNPDL